MPRKLTGYSYDFIIIVRLYLYKLAFCAFFKHNDYKESDISLGCLIYMFSFYTIVVSVRHPFYLNPSIYLPLILLGIDKFLNENKPFGFIFSVFLAAISSFYFFYMLSFAMVAYILLRSFQRHRCGLKIEKLSEGAKLVGFWLLGAGMPSVIFLLLLRCWGDREWE